jgi:hypothetical protein
MRRGLIALAMGWYLLIPRVEYDLVVDPTITTWTQNSAWDSAADCEARRTVVIEWAGQRLAAAQDPNEKADARNFAFAAIYSRCIETADPRLTRKGVPK